MSFAQFQQQLALLCQELNSFYELTATGCEIAPPAATPRDVEQMFGALSRQLLGTLPSRSPCLTSLTP
jgi:hypothetical protein